MVVAVKVHIINILSSYYIYIYMYVWGVGKRVDTDNFTDKCNVRVMGGSGGEHAASVLVIIF